MGAIVSKANGKAECSVCAQEKPQVEVFNTRCKKDHIFCHGCIRRCFTMAMQQMSTGPVTCCGTFLWTKTVRDTILGKDMASEWSDCVKAFANPDQVYCSTIKCWKPLQPPPSQFSKTTDLLCHSCGRGTCALCRMPAHAGRRRGANEDEAEAKTVITAREKGWKRCFRCYRFVERTTGCLLVPCDCGATFCYQCGKSRYICDCKLWEDGIPENVERVVAHWAL